jgi:hypothetical protein
MILFASVLLVGIVVTTDRSFSTLLDRNIRRFAGFVNYGDERMDIPAEDIKGMITGKKVKPRTVDTSIYAREAYMKESVKLAFNDFFHFIFGYGFGDFGKQSKLALHIEDHPHNIILEVLVETGLIGVLLFCAFVFLALKEARAKDVLLFVCLIYIFLNTLKSIPLVDRSFFGFLALGLFGIFHQRSKKEVAG